MPDLGKKYECFSCGTKFYDLGRPDPLCPKCGANQKQAAQDEAEQERQAARRRRKDEPKVAVEDEDLPVDDEIAAADFDEDLEGADEEGLDDEEAADDLDDEA
jgi:hypothetical protein